MQDWSSKSFLFIPYPLLNYCLLALVSCCFHDIYIKSNIISLVVIESVWYILHPIEIYWEIIKNHSRFTCSLSLYEVKASYGLYNDYGKTYSWGVRLYLFFCMYFLFGNYEAQLHCFYYIKMRVLTLNHVFHNHSLLPSSRTIAGFVLE